MSLVAFVLVLTIPVAMLAKRTPASSLVLAVWGFFLALTPAGPGVAEFLSSMGHTVLGMAA
jgi:hypothetical protein